MKHTQNILSSRTLQEFIEIYHKSIWCIVKSRNGKTGPLRQVDAWSDLLALN